MRRFHHETRCTIAKIQGYLQFGGVSGRVTSQGSGGCELKFECTSAGIGAIGMEGKRRYVLYVFIAVEKRA
jgi:hypothetical protein